MGLNGDKFLGPDNLHLGDLKEGASEIVDA